jgi:hypothetical protein
MTDSFLSTDVIRRSLRRLGWSEVGSFRGTLQYWEPRSPLDERAGQLSFPRVVLPLHNDLSDADDLLQEANEFLVQQYREEYEQAVETVRLTLSRHLDEIEVRRATTNSAGLIQWQLGNEVVISTREMLAASAKAASSKKKRFYNAEFLAQCLIGQTRVGSYVVTALTPAEASLATSMSKKTVQPRIAGRLVTETLADSLEAVKDAIAEAKTANGQIEAFEVAVASGVSHELLSALEPLTRGTESGIEISYFSTADDELSDIPAKSRSVTFTFTPEDSLVIAKAREYFEASPQPKPARLTGEVTDLKNSSAEGEHRIKLAARVNGKPKSVTVELLPDQYDSAVEAHSRGRLFTVVGELEMLKRAAHLRSPERVMIEDTAVNEVKSASRRNRSTVTPPPLFDV